MMYIFIYMAYLFPPKSVAKYHITSVAKYHINTKVGISISSNNSHHVIYHIMYHSDI